MYTEEQEFDYNEYLNESEDSNNTKSPFNKSLIFKIVLVVLAIILIIFLVFKIKNRNYDNSNNDNKFNSGKLFSSF